MSDPQNDPQDEAPAPRPKWLNDTLRSLAVAQQSADDHLGAGSALAQACRYAAFLMCALERSRAPLPDVALAIGDEESCLDLGYAVADRRLAVKVRGPYRYTVTQVTCGAGAYGDGDLEDEYEVESRAVEIFRALIDWLVTGQ